MDIIGFVLRAAKRLLVAMFGLAVVFVGYKAVFPYFSHRVPLLLALACTYGAMAYGVIPLAFRAYRLLFPSNHIPLHTVTPDGFACDPVNLALMASRANIIKAFKAAGWEMADPVTLRTSLRMVQSIVLRQPYPTAPFSALYLFGRKQDIGFQKTIGGSARLRHHVRFWQVIQPTGDRFRDHVKFWVKHYGEVQPGRSLWVGAATEDIGVTLIRHNAQFTHTIHHDTNAERDFIVDELTATGLVQGGRTLSAAKPYKLKNRVGTTMIADGNIRLLEL